MNHRRIRTGIAGLDEMLRGGFLPNSVVLIHGAPGTGKTSLGLQYLIHGATQENEPGLLISFEEFPSSLYRDAASLGWDLQELERSGAIHLMFTSPEVFLASLEHPDSPLDRVLQAGNVRRLVLDSVSHFNRITRDAQDLRHVYTRAANGLRREGLTSLLLGEESRADVKHADKGGLAFVVDAIVLLRYVEIESAIQRAVVVLKLRGSDHTKEIRCYEIGPGGLTVQGIFEGRQGLLSGAPYRAL